MDVKKQNTITVILIIGVLLAVLGPHALPTVLATLSFIVVLGFFFKLRNPVFLIILFALLYQWMQINIKIIYGNFVGLTLPEMFSYHQNDDFLYKANILSNIGLVFFTFGVYLPLSKYCKELDILKSIEPIYKNNIVKMYILISIGLSLLFTVRFFITGLNSIIAAIVRLKWGFLFLAVFYSYYYNKDKKLMNIVLLVEVALGFTGFFSAFKDIILVVLLSLSSLQKSISSKLVVSSSITFVFLVAFGLVWTAVKQDYRLYLTGGEGGQKVTVSKVDALTEMGNKLGALETKEVLEARDYLLDRLSYIEFFSKTLNYVPTVLPHQDGGVFKESVLFYFQPRLLFPDKPKIDDSEHTSKYTGVLLTGDGVASHSIGFMTDAYIDYGEIGMMFLILGIGLLFGFSINFIMTKAPNLFWGLAFVVPFYFLLAMYSFNMMKVMGNFITYIVPILLFRKAIYNATDKYFR